MLDMMIAPHPEDRDRHTIHAETLPAHGAVMALGSLALRDAVAAHLLRRTITMDADDDVLDVNCGRCGKPLRVRFDEIRDLRTIDCEDCKQLPPREPPTSKAYDGMTHHEASVRARLGARVYPQRS